VYSNALFYVDYENNEEVEAEEAGKYVYVIYYY